MQDHIILIGFMGSGKTTMGIRLSYKLRRTIIDTDKMIEKIEGRSISDIFAEDGEEYFRKKETEVLKKLQMEQVPRIISVGGGTPLREENRALLRELGTVVYLKASPETVYQRLKGDTTRPLLQGDDPQGKIEALLSEREDRYAAAADKIIIVDGKTSAEVLEEIWEVCR